MQTGLADRLTYAAFAVSVLFGGLNAIFVRVMVAELPPFWAATLRFSAASLLLILLVKLQRLPIPRGRELLGPIIYGILNIGLGYALMFWSLQTMPPGLAMVILSLAPLLTLVLAILHRQEKFRWQVLGGSLLSMTGIGIIFAQQLNLDIPLLPMLAVVLTAFCFAESGVIIKGLPKSHPITTNAIGMATGTVVLFLASLLWQEPRPLPELAATWLALAYLSLIGSCVLFILALYVLKRWTASASSYGLVLATFVTVLASALLGQETITATLLFGGALVLLGVYIGALRKPRKLPEGEIQAAVESQPAPAPTD